MLANHGPTILSKTGFVLAPLSLADVSARDRKVVQDAWRGVVRGPDRFEMAYERCHLTVFYVGRLSEAHGTDTTDESPVKGVTCPTAHHCV